ncbi:MAG TPA: hypothetical protein VMS56_04715 [Thermoanaerobaculia bacterium]|nr:hypothetical protein [Thermoanaerobaculia bacterium]
MKSSIVLLVACAAASLAACASHSMGRERLAIARRLGRHGGVAISLSRFVSRWARPAMP